MYKYFKIKASLLPLHSYYYYFHYKEFHFNASNLHNCHKPTTECHLTLYMYILYNTCTCTYCMHTVQMKCCRKHNVHTSYTYILPSPAQQTHETQQKHTNPPIPLSYLVSWEAHTQEANPFPLLPPLPAKWDEKGFIIKGGTAEGPVWARGTYQERFSFIPVIHLCID